MYTPSDIELETPSANDRPYAGYLHTEFSIQFEPHNKPNVLTLPSVQQSERALSEDAQSWRFTLDAKSDEPMGWEYQVDVSGRGRWLLKPFQPNA